MWNKLIYEFNATNREYPKDKTIHQLFEEQVERTPIELRFAWKIRNLRIVN